MMHKNAKIYVAGHKGLVGSALCRKLHENGYENLVVKTRREVDLTDQKRVAEFFNKEKPEYVFLAAAKVGGIMANNTYRADFIYQNLRIQNNIIHESYASGVKKLMFLGSSCIYPRDCPQPMKEEHLLTGPLEPTNEPYAIAKIAGIEMCWAYNHQYNTRFIPVMPTNLYGPNDNFDLETSHVLPAFLRKMHLGKCLAQNNLENLTQDLSARPIDAEKGLSSNENVLKMLQRRGVASSSLTTDHCLPTTVSVSIWGTGNPRREFLHVDDLADACVFLMNQGDPAIDYQNRPLFNIGTGEDIQIKDLADLIKEITGFSGALVFDTSKPDGTPQKLLDVAKMKILGWQAGISLRKGIAETYQWYQDKI